MKKLMNIMMLSCKKSSNLIEKKIHFSLNPIEKIQLFLHTSMCDACTRYKKESKDLDTILNNHNSITSGDSMPNEVKQNILDQIGKKK